MPATISAVLFDMDGVLCDYDRAARVAYLSAATHRGADAIRHAIWGSGLEAQADRGALDDTRYMRAIDDLLGCTVALEDWLCARRAAMSPNSAVLALADAVSTRVPIAVLTNNCHMVVDNLSFTCPEIARVFAKDDIYATASLKALKPAREAYLRCVDAMGMSAAEVLLIDDVDANVTGALDAGLAAYKFTTAEALATELRRLNLL